MKKILSLSLHTTYIFLKWRVVTCLGVSTRTQDHISNVSNWENLHEIKQAD